MKIHYCSYSDDKFKTLQKHQIVLAEEAGFDSIMPYTREWLAETKFYKQNQKMLDIKRNAGHCAWKPYVILDALDKIDYGDAVAYFDCGDYFAATIKEVFEECLSDKDSILVEAYNIQSAYTKADCFFYMDCFEDRYFNAMQLEAGILAFKKTDFNLSFLKEWQDYCCDDIINNDNDNISEHENTSNFVVHQLDQSILTNLQIKYNLPATHLGTLPVMCNSYQDEHGEIYEEYR
jgi:hypothetical protein